jgi:small-conductance mechanosensitive channel
MQDRHGTLPTRLALLMTALLVQPLRGQDLPNLTPAPAKDEAREEAPSIVAPTGDNPEATAAEAAGPIDAHATISDEAIRRRLEQLLPRYPGVRKIEVAVEGGVVTLNGHVEDREVRDRLRDFVRRVEGVTLVLNRTKTDAQVLTARQFAAKQLAEYRDVISRNWMLALLALGILAASIALARLFTRFSETLLRPLSGNPLLRSVLGSVIAGVLVIGGFLMALKILGLSEAVLSFLGLAGVVALAIGFAFREIAENFIASVLLGIRRPFRPGDYVEIAGQAGVVRALNTRATVLVTLEGSQVRIPNATIFKEILVNKSASSSVRATFDVMIGYDASTSAAQEAIGNALRELASLSKDPAPRALVEALEPGGVRLRVYCWLPATGVDGFKIQSDARLTAKVALQQAGITPAAPPPAVLVRTAGPSPADRSAPPGGPSPRPSGPRISEARKNLRQDARAASRAGDAEQVDVAEHAMSVAEDRVGDEGEDLIRHEGQSEANGRDAGPDKDAS